LVDRGPKHGKVESSRAAQVTVEQFPYVQRDMRVRYWQAGCGASLIQGGYARALTCGGVQCMFACHRRVVVGKDGEDAVTGELQHIPGVRLDFLDLRFSVIV